MARAAEPSGGTAVAVIAPPPPSPGRPEVVEPRAGHPVAARGRSLQGDRAALRGRLLEVLGYAADTLTRLDRHAALWPVEEHRGGGDGALLRRVDKVAAEGLLLAYLASRVSGDDAELERAASGVVDLAERRIATGRSEALLRRFPQMTTTLGLSYVLLGQLGRGRPEIEALLRRRIAGGWATVSERAPYRLMDSRWTFGLLDPSLLGRPEELLPFCTLAAAPHPIHNASDDDYALTHAIFYLTDFGRRAAPPELGSRAAELLDPFLAWHAVELDLDLLGEMLIAALALRVPDTPALRFAWEVLSRAWEEGGLVGPEYSADRAGELRGEAREAYEVSENYHTVFVGGILCAVALGVEGTAANAAPHCPASVASADDAAALRTGGERCRAVAEQIGGRECLDDAPPIPQPPDADDLLEWTVAHLLQALEVALDPPPPWLRAAAASELGRDGIGRCLYDALVVATARRYRLNQLAEALAVGASHPALRSASFHRALEFLLDQQLAGGFLGVHALLTEDGSTEATRPAQGALARQLARIGTGLAPPH